MVRLYWNAHLYPCPDCGGEPEPKQPKFVRILMSAGGAYQEIHQAPGGSELDSFVVSGLTNGSPYSFRIGWYDDSDRLTYLFDPILVHPGAYPSAIRRLEIYPAYFPSEPRLAWSPAGDSIAYLERSLSLLDAQTLQERWVTNQGVPYDGVAYSPSGRWIAYGGGDGGLWMHDRESGQDITVAQGSVPNWGGTDTLLYFVHRAIQQQYQPTIPDQLCRMNPFDSTSVRVITPAKVPNGQAAIAVRGSDGKIVLSSVDDETLSKKLYFVSSDHRRVTLFPGNASWDDELPSWSPSGRYVLFTSNRSGHAEIWALDTETQKFRQLTGSASRSARRMQAVWSPDGTRLAVLEAYGYSDFEIAIYPVSE